MSPKKLNAQQRLKAILRGAFDGPPVPLKEIPKRDGTIRNLSNRKSSEDASGATAKIDAPQKKNRNA